MNNKKEPANICDNYAGLWFIYQSHWRMLLHLNVKLTFTCLVNFHF